MRPKTRVALLAIVAATLLAAGCGGSDAETGKVGDIEIAGSNSEDLGVATSMAEYINRGCKKNLSLNFPAFIARVSGSDSASVSERKYYLARYGGLTEAYQSLLERCITYGSIEVEGDEFTVKTTLGHRLIDSVTAADTCGEIRASHAADSTPGRVVDVEGELLAECKADELS